MPNVGIQKDGGNQTARTQKGDGNMRYNLTAIMTRAWKNYRKGGLTFSEALHRSWISAKAEAVNGERIRQAAGNVGITETVNTWTGWKAAGYEVIHGSKALFGADLIYASKGDAAIYKARFFGLSQVQPLQAGA